MIPKNSSFDNVFFMGIYEIFENNERADVSSFKANKKLKESYVHNFMIPSEIILSESCHER